MAFQGQRPGVPYGFVTFLAQDWLYMMPCATLRRGEMPGGAACRFPRPPWQAAYYWLRCSLQLLPATRFRPCNPVGGEKSKMAPANPTGYGHISTRLRRIGKRSSGATRTPKTPRTLGRRLELSRYLRRPSSIV